MAGLAGVSREATTIDTSLANRAAPAVPVGTGLPPLTPGTAAPTQNQAQPAENQAALWAAKLDGSTLSASERQALDAWARQQPETLADMAARPCTGDPQACAPEIGLRKWLVRNDLRRFVIFGRHDLVRDAPISHLDLLVSRNTLMYFNSEVQGRIVNRFHFALRDTGLLFLGKAEMMRAHGNLFAPADLKARIFAKVPRANLRDRLLAHGRPELREMDSRATPGFAPASRRRSSSGRLARIHVRTSSRNASSSGE